MRRSLTLLAAPAVLWVLLSAAPASASLSPECDASATLVGEDFTTQVDPKASDRVKIPRAADVQYDGRIQLPEGQQYTYSGAVKLKVAFMELDLASWDWGGDTQSVSASGTTDYDLDLPAGLLGGVKAKASGSHTQGSITCTGSLDIAIDGNAVNAASAASAVVTAGGAAGLALAGLGRP